MCGDTPFVKRQNLVLFISGGMSQILFSGTAERFDSGGGGGQKSGEGKRMGSGASPQKKFRVTPFLEAREWIFWKP